MSTRQNKSRSKELDIVLTVFKENISELKSYIESNPQVGLYKENRNFFQYGNISRLIKHINWNIKNYNNPIKDIIGIYHIDSMNRHDKFQVETQLNLKSGILTNKSKADLLILTSNEKVYLCSYKDGTSASKLGQVSAETRYGNASLKGGFILPFPRPANISNINLELNYSCLSDVKFKQLNEKDRYYANVKNLFNNEWSSYVTETYKESIFQLNLFKNKIMQNKVVFSDFVLLTLFGRLNIPEYCYILINEILIPSRKIINFLTRKEYNIICENYNSKNKYSLIIKLIVDDKTYCITKIEPSFDGSKTNVSQTKGIIYYFQEYPINGDNIWKLLKDISEDIV